MSERVFARDLERLQELARGRGGAMATDEIMVKGRPVGYAFREEPDNELDSGWCFTAGDESEAYMADTDNLDVYDVNTIANYDPEIIPFLDAPPGAVLLRERGTGRLVRADMEG